MAETIRSFVAFKLPSRIIDLAAGLQSSLKAEGLKLRWVAPRNLHLTLKFLGDIPSADADRVGAAVRRACQGEMPLALTVQGMGVFPGIKRPRVLWIGLGGQIQELERLYSRIEAELAELGFAKEKRGFTAHLTLARFKGAVRPDDLLKAFRDLGNYAPEPFEVSRLVLYQSELKPGGAVYSELAHVDFKKF